MQVPVLFLGVIVVSLFVCNLAAPMTFEILKSFQEAGESISSLRDSAFTKRLDSIDKELLLSANQRLEDQRKEGIEEHVEIINNASPKEKQLLLNSFTNLYENHPEAKTELDEFFQSKNMTLAGEADAKFNKYEEWTTYWNTWFKIFTDYLQRYG